MGDFSATIESSPEEHASPGALTGLVAATSLFAREKIALVLERLAFYGLLSVFLLAAIPYGAVQPWWTAVINCLVFFLASLRVVEAILRRDLRIAGAGMIIPLLALCLFAAFQTLPLGALNLSTIHSNASWTISTDPQETQRFVFRWLALTIAGESLLRYTTTRRRLGALVSAVIGIGVASAGFGILRQVTQTNSSSFILPGIEAGVGYGQFINRNHFALLMEMTLGLLVGLIVGKSGHRGRFLSYLAMALLVWSALVFTNSRGGVISMLGLILFAAITHFAILRWRSSKREGRRSQSRLAKLAISLVMIIVVVVPLVFVTAVGVLWVGGDPVVHRLETVSGELREGGVGKLRRQEIWRATWQLIKAHPLSGTGFGGYETAIPEFNTNFSGYAPLSQAHNDYLEILASGGIIGALFVSWFMIAVIRQILAQLRAANHFRYGTCLGAFAGLFAVGIHSVFDFGLHIPANALVFACLVAIATANCSSRPRKSLVPRTDL